MQLLIKHDNVPTSLVKTIVSIDMYVRPLQIGIDKALLFEIFSANVVVARTYHVMRNYTHRHLYTM